jgi:RNA polymerase sigma-70 factor (ECF subfamily)
LDDPRILRKPLAYLYGIAANVLADFKSSQARDRTYVTIDTEMVENWCKTACSTSAAEHFDRIALETILSHALRQLPTTQAAVLVAHKGDGLTYSEVATKLGLSIHTVEKYVTQAKARLRATSRLK